MRWPVIYFIGFIFLFISCNNEKAASNLEQAFIESLKDGQFKTLEPYFPTRELYRSIATDSSTKPDSEVDSFLAKSNERLKNSWHKIAAIVKGRNIDPGKVTIKETVLYDPFKKGKIQAMVVVYDYEGKTWDDLTLIVKKADKKTYLLEIPNPTDVFSFIDTSLRELSLAKSTLELEKPGFTQSVQDLVKQLIKWANEDNIKDFSAFVVYGGDDKSRSWNSPVNMADPVESKIATGRLDKIKNAMKDCKDYSFGKITGERESEGFWIIQPVTCGDRIVYFSFLKIKDKFLFGDIDAGDKQNGY